MVVQSVQPPSQKNCILQGVLALALNLDHLHAFLVVTEEGSINRAAVRLLRAQTAVGRQIKLLEEAMGVALFERT
ncbi:MAG TPA: LysR family transcriptional regulator, partial [Advenella sp.]|nr:LysR family transcriptional regulator [Advenella sp.]